MDDFQKTGFNRILNTFCQLSPLLIVFFLVVFVVPCIFAKFILPLIPGLSDKASITLIVIAVILCLFLYIYNVLFVPRGKKDRICVFLMLLPNKFYNDKKYIGNTIVFELEKDEKSQVFFPNFLARCFANYAFTKHYRHKLLCRLYKKYFYSMSNADIIVCGELNDETKDGNKICTLMLFFIKKDKENSKTFGENYGFKKFEIDLKNTNTAFDEAIEAIKEEVNLLKEKEKTS